MSLSGALDAAVGVAHSVIEGLAALLDPITGGTSVAVAIVLFTLAVRLLISPLTVVQVRHERRRAALAPRLAKLRRKYRDDPAKLAAETLALYRANGARPLAGLLPALVQAPFFMIMYRVALDAPTGSLLGVPLSAHLSAGLPVFAVLLAIATALAWVSSRRIRHTAAVASALATRTAARPAPPPHKNSPILELWLALRRSSPDLRQPQLQDRGKEGRPDRGKEGRPDRGKEGRPDRGTGTQRDGGALTAMMPWLPFAGVLAVAWLPLAGALYLATSMAWTTLERSALPLF